MIIMAMVIFSSWYYYPYYVVAQLEAISPKPVPDANSFGDLYGALNTLFSGLAFLGVIISIWFQSEELNDTRREISKQTALFSTQNDAMDKQSFENTFFQLLGLNNEIIKMASVDITFTDKLDNKQSFKGDGRAAFKELSLYFFVYKEKSADNWAGAYEKFHSEVDDILGHYFRSIYQTLKLIDNAPFSYIEKKEYANMLRAQMSKYELGLLFYNCICKLGNIKFKPLLEKYEFFEHLSLSIKIESSLLLEYDIAVFGFTNRDCYVSYLTELIKKGLDDNKKVFGYFVCNERLERNEIIKIACSDGNTPSSTFAAKVMKNQLEKRALVWIEVEPN